MDPRFSEMHNTMNGFRFDDETVLPIFGQSHDQVTGYKDDVSLDLNIADIPFLSFSPSRENFTPSLSGSTEVESPDDQDSDPVLKYLNQILIEENMDDKPSMFHDPLALQAAEKSLYDVLGQKYPPSPLQQSDYFNHSSGSREETGRRLAKYCERFGVPFEYQAIATQNWETIKIEDLKITHGEVLAVNCLFRFGRLLDETVEADCPRDAVLNLIRKMNPTIFLHAVTSGSYSAPFFITRFKEALFHYSALFDMLDATLPRDNPQRMNFEQDFYGREIINVIACEGAGRVERPETHKQWQVRTMRAGFKPLPLNREIMKKLRNKVMAGYHKDFLFDEDSNWMLQGWKGRIICGSSCWVPA
ncbi:scarecrow 14 [Olea europaea subsp. europaea]|nr:scarecrow 14 [Olea europaea subsp. europaea]